jgi:hypothetical protein
VITDKGAPAEIRLAGAGIRFDTHAAAPIARAQSPCESAIGEFSIAGFSAHFLDKCAPRSPRIIDS